MRHRLLILFFILIIPMAAKAQNCGLADTILIQSNSTSTVDFTLTDYFNNDLSDPMQGLCGVELHFFHQLSENLEVSLTSPAGQTVNLIGPNTNDPFAFTFFTKWKITFVQCSETAMPDLGYLAQWDNDQPNNFVSGGQYDGSYHPYNGCLEDFNTGPVNGQWTFTINNDPSNYPGAFVFMRLIFCDSRGVDCCFAVPGAINEPDLLTCEGDSSLIFDPEMFFITGPADTSEYGYQYTIFEDSLLIAYDSTLNLLNYPAGQYEVCGLSYRLTELDSLPVADGTLRLEIFRDSLNSLTPWFCGKLTDSCMLIHIVATPDPVSFEQTICAGDSIMVGDTTLMEEGLHTITLLNYAGCDSIVNVNLHLEQSPIIEVDSTICLGDSVQVGSSVYFNSGMFSDTLQTYDLGCDSIVNLTLTVLQPVFVDRNVTICAGDSFAVGDSIFTEQGVYSVLMTSAAGCDSTVNLTLNVLQVTALVTEPDTINCFNQGIFLNGSSSQPQGQLTYGWYNIQGQFLGSGLLLMVEEADTIYLEVSATLNTTTCFNRDTVIVIESLAAPMADAGLPDTITCAQPTVTLGGPATTMGPGIGYQWATPAGHFVSASNLKMPVVDGAGEYTLVVTDLENGCRDTSSVVIAVDTLAPIAEAGAGFVINCLTLDGSLSSSGSSFGSLYESSWAGPCIETLPTDPDITVSCAGTYYFLVENQENGCMATDSVLVTGNHELPSAIIVTPGTLNCLQDQIVLDGSGSTPQDSLLFAWTGPGIVGGHDIANPLINLQGVYTLTVTNMFNFCENSTMVTVVKDTLRPVADAGLDGILTCDIPELPLGGPNTSLGAQFTYSWVTSEGHFTQPLGGPFNAADSSGVYQLEVINEINGCRDTSSVIFGADQQIPYVDGGPDLEFTCGDESLILDGSNSDITQNLAVQWTGPCIEPPANDLVITINCPGTYYLALTDVDSGCQARDTVVVSTDPAALFAVLPDSAFISCETGSVTLDGSASSLAIYQWLLDGQPVVLSGNSPTVSQPGFYQLVVSSINQVCIDTAGIEVVLDCDFEVNLAYEPQPITCGESITFVDTEVTPPNPNYVYAWQGPAPGCVLANSTTQDIQVICAGLYTLIVTNPAIGISDTLSVEVFANEGVPVAEAGPSDTLTCTQETVFLDGTESSTGLSIAYVWTSISDDTLGFQPLIAVNTPGIYFLEVVDTLNDCSAFDVVEVFMNNTDPNIVFGNSVFLCESDTFALEAFVSPVTGVYEYTWSGPGIVSADSSVVLIDTTGAYVLEVLNTQNGCMATGTVNVVEQICIPCLEILPPDVLTCDVESIVLQGQFCEPCGGCEIEWTTSNGEIISDATSLNPVVGAPGIYNFTATDTLGYSTTVSVTVSGLFDLPDVFAGPDATITCDSSSVTLGDDMTSSGPDFNYSWTSLSGSLIPPTDQRFAMAFEPGIFVLEVVNVLTGCLHSDTVVVAIDTLPPVANAGSDQFLTCDVSLIILDGSGSSLGNNYSYGWQAPALNCLMGVNSLNPIVSCEGTYLLTVTNMLNGCTDTSSVHVGITEDIPEIQPIPGGVLDCQTNLITLTGNTPQPAASYSVTWCPLDVSGNPVTGECIDNLEFQVNTPGSYQFQVIDNNSGCSNELTVMVTQDTVPPMVDAGLDGTLLCNSDSLVLQGTAGPDIAFIDFLWTANGGQLIHHPTDLQAVIFDPGVYYLQGTSTTNNCTSVDSVVISLDVNIPVVEAGQDTTLTCSVTTLILEGSAQTSSGNASFLWSTPDGNILNGNATATPEIDQPGIYFLTVLDDQNGCEATDSLLVDQMTDAPTAMINGLGTLELTCSVDSLIIEAAGSLSATGAPLAFQWQVVDDGHLFGDLMADSVGVDASGLFLLLVTDTENGCLDSLEFIVEENTILPPILYAPPLDLDCANEQVVIDATATDTAGMMVTWSTEAEGIILEDALSLLVFEPGVYMLTVVNEENGCESTVDIFIDIDTLSPTVIIQPISEMLDCEVREVKIDARNSSTGSQYFAHWVANPGLILSGQDSLVAFVGEAGNYTLEILNTANGCSAAETVTVLESAAPLTGVAVTVIEPGCLNNAGGSIAVDAVLGGTPLFLYSLNGSSFSSTSVFSGLTAGVYELVIRDVNGCEWQESIVLLEPEELVVDLGPDIELVLGDSVRVEALVNRTTYDTLYWMPTDAFEDPSNPVQVLNPEVTTAYSVFVVDENGCTDSDVILINLVKPRQFYIPNVFSPANDDGNNDIFMIFGGPEVKEILTFQVYDRWGNLVYEHEHFQPNDPTFGWDGTLDGRLMNAAVFGYYVSIEFVDGWIEQVKGDVILVR